MTETENTSHRHSVDITVENAQQLIIDESKQRLVLVDFWADWCQPCKSLAPVLEKLADEYDGQFLLAKINADEQQMLAGQFGVRSLPTVMLVKDGQPVDGFAGAQPDSELRTLLDKYLPKPWDVKFKRGLELIESDDIAAALTELNLAYEESSQRADIAFALARCLIQAKRLDQAEAIIAAVKLVDQDAEFAQLKAKLDLALEAGKSPEIEALEQELAASPDDLKLALKLAVQYAQSEHTQDALDLLFSMLQRDLNAVEGEVRKAFTDILQSLNKGDTLAVQYQRKFYTLLY